MSVASAKRRRIGVISPYWNFWESAVGPHFPQDRRELASRAVATLEQVVDVAWEETVQHHGYVAALLQRVDSHVDAIVVASTMAASPSAVIAIFDGLPRLPIVLWSLHEGRAVDASFGHTGITERGGTVGVPMFGAHLTRLGRPYDVVASDIDDRAAIGPAVLAAAAAGAVMRSRIAVIGSPIPGYEWARVPNETLQELGVTVVERSAQELADRLPATGSRDESVPDGFTVDPAVSEDDLDRSNRYTSALSALVADEQIDAGTLNCHVPELRLGIGSAPCMALGICTSRGVPWTCTGDVATALAMLMVAALGAPTLYHEIEALDEVTDEAIVANSGEHDSRFASIGSKSIIINPWFDPEIGTASAEFTIAPGPASLVGVSLDADAKLTAVVATGRFTERESHATGTPNAAFVFDSGPITEAWQRWSLSGVGHHSCATDRDVSREIEAMCRHLRIGFARV